MSPFRSVRCSLAATGVAAFVLAIGISAGRAEEYQVYRGLLHAHTLFCDGSGTSEEAYAMAKDAGCDFFAVTPHNHAHAEDGAKERADGIMIATDHRLYESNDELDVVLKNGTPKHVKAMRLAATQATSATFLAGTGEEFSTISSGNHVNVLGYDQVLTNPNGDFKGMFQTLDAAVAAGSPVPVVQLNHPDVQADLFYSGASAKARKQMFNDYGFGEFGEDFGAMVKAEGRYVALVELLSGPAMAKKANPHFRYTAVHENDYYFYLAQGFHVSPSVGQDNHYPTWGGSSAARMGVYAAALTQDALFAAFRANRTFAAEDRNLTLKLTANGALMGSCLDLSSGADLHIEVAVADGDEPNAHYDVVLVRGTVEPQTKATLHRLVAADGEVESAQRDGDGTVGFDVSTSGNPEFFYARVTQDDGDRSWTAPVWINSPRENLPAAAGTETWVWSSNPSSKVYHHAWCRVAERISQPNLRTGTKPPEGRTLHACKPAEDPGE